MRPFLALLLAAGPVAAAAQTVTPALGQVLFDDSSTYTVSRAKCDLGAGQTIGLTWQLQLEAGTWVLSDGKVEVWATSNANAGSNYCPTTGAGTALIATVTSPTSATQLTPVVVNVKQLLDAAVYTCDAADKPIYVCAQWWSTTGSAYKGWARGTIDLKVAGPNAPSITRIAPGNGALEVTIAKDAAGVAATKFKAVAVLDPVDPASPKHWSNEILAEGDARIEGLVNGLTYTVTAYAWSADGNESPASDPVAGMPQETSDLWKYYRNAGGRETGGCQAGGAGLAALLGALALGRLRRRS
jgi:hypothetical protein